MSYNPSFSPPRGIARVEVYIDRGDHDVNKQLFDALEDRKELIESGIPGEWEWERLDNRRACRISAIRAASIDDDRETLEELQDWMVNRLLAFKRVFTPHLQELVG